LFLQDGGHLPRLRRQLSIMVEGSNMNLDQGTVNIVLLISSVLAITAGAFVLWGVGGALITFGVFGLVGMWIANGI